MRQKRIVKINRNVRHNEQKQGVHDERQKHSVISSFLVDHMNERVVTHVVGVDYFENVSAVLFVWLVVDVFFKRFTRWFLIEISVNISIYRER